MERLIKPSIPSTPKDAPSLKVNIIRHGPSSYRQPDWHDPDTANDLNTVGRYIDGEKTPQQIAEGKAEAMAIIKVSANKIAAEIQPGEEVAIWSSPTGRTLETARIIRDVLQEKGIPIRKKGRAKEQAISVFERFGEVKNFSWSLFEPLMNGGEVIMDGTTFTLDKARTNPKNLGYPAYFTSDAIRAIPAETKQTWPRAFIDEIEQFESFTEVTDRLINALKKIKKISDKNYRIILVTHDALTGSLVKAFTAEQFSGVQPGQF